MFTPKKFILFTFFSVALLIAVGYHYAKSEVREYYKSDDFHSLMTEIITDVTGIFSQQNRVVIGSITPIKGFDVSIRNVSIKGRKGRTIYTIEQILIRPRIMSSLLNLGVSFIAAVELPEAAVITGSSIFVFDQHFLRTHGYLPVKSLNLSLKSLPLAQVKRITDKKSELYTYLTHIDGTLSGGLTYTNNTPTQPVLAKGKASLSVIRLKLQNLHRRVPPITFNNVETSLSYSNGRASTIKPATLNSKMLKLKASGFFDLNKSNNQKDILIDIKSNIAITGVIAKVLGCRYKVPFSLTSLTTTKNTKFKIAGTANNERCSKVK